MQTQIRKMELLSGSWHNVTCALLAGNDPHVAVKENQSIHIHAMVMVLFRVALLLVYIFYVVAEANTSAYK